MIFMKKYIPVLKRTRLFAGVGEEEILAMLDCLQAAEGRYEKGSYIFCQGESVRDIFVLAERDGFHIQKDDYWETEVSLMC